VSQPESRLQRRIRKAVQRQFGGYWWKVHGGPFTPAGIPDLAGVVAGRAVFLEVKRPGEEASLVQRKRMRDLERAGAIVAVVHSVAEAIDAMTPLMFEDE